MMFARPTPGAVAACALATLIAAPGVFAQPAPAAALGAPAEGRLATPAAAATVQPGDDADTPQKALMKAMTANDVPDVIAAGGSATQAALSYYLRQRGPNARFDPAEESFIGSLFANARYVAEDGKLGVVFGINQKADGPSGYYWFGPLSLPEGNAGLPRPADIGAADLGILSLPEPLPPGPERSLPEIPATWLAKAP